MDSKTTLPVTEVRRRLFSIIDDVYRHSGHYTLTDKGVPKAVILSVEEYESWMETFEVMKDFPELRSDIEAARNDLEKGGVKTLKEMVGKQKRGSGVSGSTAKKSPKRSGKNK